MTAPAGDLAQFLTRCEWLPPVCDPARALQAIAQSHVDAVWSDAQHAPATGAPVVERLAIAFGMLRRGDAAASTPPGVLSALEHLGLEVSPEFAEQGVLALRLLEILASDSNDPVLLELAARAMGQLWEAAFEAPSGFAAYIARSIMGRSRSGWSWVGEEGLAESATTRERLLHELELFHAALALSQQPALSWPQSPPELLWRRPAIARIESGLGRVKPGWLSVHSVPLTVSGPNTVGRVQVGLSYTDAQLRLEPVAWCECVIVQTHTGATEELVDLVETGTLANPAELRRVIQSVFANPDVVSQPPRVRRLLDRSEHLLQRVLVVERLDVANGWRGHGLGGRLLMQLLVEAGELDAALGRPRAILPSELDLSQALGARAARAMQALRQAHIWFDFGGEFLINGVMGLALPEVGSLRNQGLWDRATPD